MKTFCSQPNQRPKETVQGLRHTPSMWHKPQSMWLTELDLAPHGPLTIPRVSPGGPLYPVWPSWPPAPQSPAAVLP